MLRLFSASRLDGQRTLTMLTLINMFLLSCYVSLQDSMESGEDIDEVEVLLYSTCDRCS